LTAQKKEAINNFNQDSENAGSEKPKSDPKQDLAATGTEVSACAQ